MKEEAVMLRLITFGCLFIASEDVTVSTTQAETRMCRSAAVARRSLWPRVTAEMGSGRWVKSREMMRRRTNTEKSGGPGF